MSVAKVSEISATSTKSFEDAIQQGIERANKTIRNVQSAWIKEQQVRLNKGSITEYRGQHDDHLRHRRLDPLAQAVCSGASVRYACSRPARKKEIRMRILAILFLVAGALALTYGGFSYTSDTHEAKLGPVEINITEKEHVNVPVWAGVALLVAGGGILLQGRSSASGGSKAVADAPHPRPDAGDGNCSHTTTCRRSGFRNPKRARRKHGNLDGLFSKKEKSRTDFSNVRSGGSSTAPSPGRNRPGNERAFRDQGANLRRRQRRQPVQDREARYGDAKKWTNIYEANWNLIKDPDLDLPWTRTANPESLRRKN